MKAILSLRLVLLLIIVTCYSNSYSQHNYIHDTQRIHSLQLIADGDQLLPAVLPLDSHKQFTLSFDEFGHNYSRLVYKITHCNYLWEPADESLFESDYLAGLNAQPIDDYDTSFNTNQLYTHYSFTFPNSELKLLLSGNYIIQVFDDEEYNHSSSPQPLLTSQFCLYEPLMTINADLSSNTDIDFNTIHQQLSYSISYGSLSVTDPLRELHTVVKQNLRDDNAIVDLEPNIRKANGVEYTHRKELIFEAGNEFHKFETIDLHRANLNIDNVRWYDPYYHFTIYPDKPIYNYVYDEDANGAFILRNAEYDNEEISSEYVFVHFTILADKPLDGGNIYVCGDWTNTTFDDTCIMTYDDTTKQYNGVAYLKQGYYNYQYRQITPSGYGTTANVDGNFYETENLYTIYIYYRQPGGRYDRLVSYAKISSR